MKAILLLFILFPFSFCASQKKTEKHFTASGVSVETSATVISETVRSSAGIENEKNETENTDLHIIRYDTAQPVDSITGKPPVKEEEFRFTKKKTDEKTKAAADNKVETVSAGKESIAQRTGINTGEKADVSADIAGGSNFILLWIIFVPVIGMAVLFGIFIRKKSKIYDNTFDNTFQ